MKIKHLSWIPALSLMLIIFIFSSKPAKESGESSMTIAKHILNIYESMSDVKIYKENRIDTLKKVDHFVRKSAHFLEYMVLAVAFYLPLWLVMNRKGLQLVLLSVLMTVMYAVTDEVHQLFVMGRSGEVKDVLIDSFGALTGAILFYFLIRLYMCIGTRDE